MVWPKEGEKDGPRCIPQAAEDNPGAGAQRIPVILKSVKSSLTFPMRVLCIYPESFQNQAATCLATLTTCAWVYSSNPSTDCSTPTPEPLNPAIGI